MRSSPFLDISHLFFLFLMVAIPGHDQPHSWIGDVHGLLPCLLAGLELSNRNSTQDSSEEVDAETDRISAVNPGPGRGPSGTGS